MFQLRTIPCAEGKRKGIPCAFKYQRAFMNHDQEHKEFDNDNIRGFYMTDLIEGMPTNYGKDIENNLHNVKVKLKYTEEECEDLFNRFAKLFTEVLVN